MGLIEKQFFGAGATVGGAIASLLCYFFPSITIWVMLYFFVVASISLYQLKNELHRFI